MRYRNLQLDCNLFSDPKKNFQPINKQKIWQIINILVTQLTGSLCVLRLAVRQHSGVQTHCFVLNH